MDDLEHTTSGIARISKRHGSLYRWAGLYRRRCEHEMDRRGGRPGRDRRQEDVSPPRTTARALRSTSVLVLRELIAAPFQRGTQTFLLPDLGEFDADVGSCRIERSHDVEPGMHRIGEAH